MALQEKGHRIIALDEICVADTLQALSPDIILSHKAHWWPDELFAKPAYLKMAISKAQKIKKGQAKSMKELATPRAKLVWNEKDKTVAAKEIKKAKSKDLIRLLSKSVDIYKKKGTERWLVNADG